MQSRNWSQTHHRLIHCFDIHNTVCVTFITATINGGKDGVTPLFVWNLSFPLIDPLCTFHCLWFASTHTNELILSPAACSEWLWAAQPGRTGPAVQQTFDRYLYLHANPRLVCVRSFPQILFVLTGCLIMVQLNCLQCFIICMWKTRAFFKLKLALSTRT